MTIAAEARHEGCASVVSRRWTDAAIGHALQRLVGLRRGPTKASAKLTSIRGLIPVKLVDFISGQLSTSLLSACYSPSNVVQRLVAAAQETVHAAGKTDQDQLEGQDSSMAAPRRWQGFKASSAGQCRESKHVQLAETTGAPASAAVLAAARALARGHETEDSDTGGL